MRVSGRGFSAVILGLVALGSAANGPASAQQPPFPNAMAPAAGLANAAVLGQTLQGGPLTYGALASTAGYGSLATPYAGAPLGYGMMMPYGGGIYGAMIGMGYGALGAYYSGMNTAGMYSGLSGGYQGYLSGAAAITNANAKYWLTISQARLTRQEALRSAIQTRRAMIEQAEYERAHMPDPDKIRQDQLRRELDRARVSPPMTEVWSGNSLNVLLRNLITQQGQGVRGPNVPLSEDTLKSINLTAGDTRGNVGLLKEQGNLQWPQPLQSAPFKDAREDLTRRLKQAVDTVSVGNKTPDPSTLNDLTADLKKLEETLDATVSELSPDQFTEARRFLRLVNNAVTALKSPDVANWFNGSRTARSKNVAELVKFMADKGLWFAPATPSDEPAYQALYHALAAYDAATARVAGSGDTK
jgi:hypothetical protein